MTWDEVIRQHKIAQRQMQIASEHLLRAELNSRHCADRLTDALLSCQEANSMINKESGN